METFRAFVVDQTDAGWESGIRALTVDALPTGEVTIRVRYSSVNYKDGICSLPNSRLVTRYPMVPGIDLAGDVIESLDSRFHPGDPVIVTSYDLGTGHFGGYSEIARVPAAWVVPLPTGLSLREAMILGTAGFTAALSLQRMEENGLRPDSGPVLVTGATGGVGSTAVAMFSKLGYHVIASTRKQSEHAFLRELGAQEIISPDELVLHEGDSFANLPARFAGVVDPVAGKGLPYILNTLKYGGCVTVSGYTGGPDFSTSVFPFLRRAITLIGIDSVLCPMSIRAPLWERIASELKPQQVLERMVEEISLDQLPQTLERILKGDMRGRAIVKF
ncbi:putative YhdH/YhfP family quinone oxidoreductase [Alicyclobacillus sacchari]|uniref:Putative YhdH/YhfP family quinone oxidoreductase n=1 Tax=Alicyclobacillus sacchari TaxID=392010 RepID=A0A4R8LQB9_9BACL|nr:acryloyl-CoA reductase [Alicyclobacillus sacchari]TDY49733.1 putative YhdH/YhfP family quinone oxidoreductase [Alicyclobacillus sacchari]